MKKRLAWWKSGRNQYWRVIETWKKSKKEVCCGYTILWKCRLRPVYLSSLKGGRAYQRETKKCLKSRSRRSFEEWKMKFLEGKWYERKMMKISRVKLLKSIIERRATSTRGVCRNDQKKKKIARRNHLWYDISNQHRRKKKNVGVAYKIIDGAPFTRKRRRTRTCCGKHHIKPRK